MELDKLHKTLKDLNQQNEKGYIYMNPLDYYSITPNHLSDKTCLFGIEVTLSPYIERGTLFATDNLIDKETLNDLKEH